MILGELIKAYREKHNLSIEALAKRIGIDNTTLWRWEKGQNFRQSTVRKLLDWLLKEGK